MNLSWHYFKLFLIDKLRFLVLLIKYSFTIFSKSKIIVNHSKLDLTTFQKLSNLN